MSQRFSPLDNTLSPRGKIFLLLLIVPLLVSLVFPLWRISLVAPQYPSGLYMEIFTYKLDGGNNGQHVKEINTLNHYIGMKTLDRAELTDLDWMPFGFGALALLALRVATIGNLRALVDLVVLTWYFSLFSLGRFVFKLYTYGHNLDPRAPIHMDPFMPALFGEKQLANFMTTSYPQAGTFLYGAFVAGISVLLIQQLLAARAIEHA